MLADPEVGERVRARYDLTGDRGAPALRGQVGTVIEVDGASYAIGGRIVVEWDESGTGRCDPADIEPAGGGGDDEVA